MRSGSIAPPPAAVVHPHLWNRSSQELRSPLRTRSGCCLGCQFVGAAWAEKAFSWSLEDFGLGFFCVFLRAPGWAREKFKLEGDQQGVLSTVQCQTVSFSTFGGEGCVCVCVCACAHVCVHVCPCCRWCEKTTRPGISSREAPLTSTRQLRRGSWRCGKTFRHWLRQEVPLLICTGRRPQRISRCSKLTSQVPGMGEWTPSQHILA